MTCAVFEQFNYPHLRNGVNEAMRVCFFTSILALLAETASAPVVSLKEINLPAADTNRLVAIVGARLIDGKGGAPVSNAVVVVRGAKIAAAGSRKSAKIPVGAEVFNATGKTLLPGFIDSHFHIERDYELPALVLSRGVTSLRDPGHWIEIYDPIRRSEMPQPRCFVAGPHLDCPPHAHPQDALAVTNADEDRRAVNRVVDEGASVIIVYYRLPLELLAECQLTPMEIIAATARNNAEFFRVSVRLGTIEPGKLADLVLLASDPLQDIRAMRRVERVMLNGRWLTPPTSDKSK